ncbi:MAG: glutamyl-tRNA reductase, partial [Helicobacter sp.]|nr:glutamyl-tRNA reductase [Helicobacter sp.]
MSILCIKHLLNHHAEIILINRDLKNAQAICEKTLDSTPQAKISVKNFEDIREWINKTPLLFTATSAPYSIIHQDLVQSLEQDRYWFDLAVPRDIKGIHEKNIKVFTIDDLEDIVKKNLALRENQAKIAYGIVGNFTQEFLNWINKLNIEPLIKTIRQQAKESAQSELAKGIAKGFLPKEYEKNIEKTLHNAFNIFLHDFTVHLRSIANTPQSDSIVEAIQFLFNKEKNPLMLEQYKCEYTENKLTDKEK